MIIGLVGGAAAWCALAMGAAVVIGRAARTADQREHRPPRPAQDPDPLADQPVEVLSRAEVNDRFRQMVAPLSTWESWL